MIKLLIIAAIVMYIMRAFWRLMYPRLPEAPKPLELKACEYCGILAREDKGFTKRDRFFCGIDHAQRFFS